MIFGWCSKFSKLTRSDTTGILSDGEIMYSAAISCNKDNLVMEIEIQEM